MKQVAHRSETWTVDLGRLEPDQMGIWIVDFVAGDGTRRQVRLANDPLELSDDQLTLALEESLSAPVDSGDAGIQPPDGGAVAEESGVASPPSPCLNCGNMAEGQFCSVCGQRTRTGRLHLEEFLRETAEIVGHFTNRFGSTFFELTFRPGETITAYLKGKRVRYQNPVSYFLVSWAALALCSKYIYAPSKLPPGAINKLPEEAVSLCMVVIAAGTHWVVFIPSLMFAESIVVFLFVYGTMFVDASALMIIEVAFKDAIRRLAHPLVVAVSAGRIDPSQHNFIRGMIIDGPLIVILILQFGKVGQYMGLRFYRVVLAIVWGILVYLVVLFLLGMLDL